ncbi:MAG TPA: hypothetical protein VGN80_19080 [Devosiaceae bacterium]|jgi:hypothetical protein|nr:hypothetical protein [Devosiaceae bacterium]
METWPEAVPSEPLAGTFQALPFREPDRTDMEDGSRRGRRSTTKNIATLTFTVRMSNAAFDVFKAWVRDDLVDGVLEFTMPVWTGSGFAERTCSFRERYADDAGHGLRHRVRLVLDVEDY